MATVISDPVLKNSWLKSCPEPVHSPTASFPGLLGGAALKVTPSPDPKGGVHVHWLLTHCAVFKERVAFFPSSYSSPYVLPHVGSRGEPAFEFPPLRGFSTHLSSETLYEPLEPSVR
ncbi:MAG: hypothetical protein ACRDYX_18385 [Egibacteraceae bacterium]